MNRKHRRRYIGILTCLVVAGLGVGLTAPHLAQGRYEPKTSLHAEARTLATSNDRNTPALLRDVGFITTHSGKTPTIQEPATPHIPQVPVNQTSLSSATLKNDVYTLQQLLAQHPGDGITRGPDQLVYNIDAAIDPTQHAVSGHLQLHLHNNLGSDITKLYFNVWPDAPHYRAAGGFESISNVSVGGQSANFSQQGTVLVVRLNHPLLPNESAQVSMDFNSLLPHIDDRYGWFGTTLNLGNWFPILAVHDEYGWITPPYYSDGESFYSLTGTFHVNVSAPSNLVLAISGEQVSEPIKSNGMTLYHYVAAGVRDVAIDADTGYKVLTAQAGPTTIFTYYTSSEANQAQAMEQAAEQALAFYNKHFGRYPYPTLRVCAMNGWFGGMEYPQLVMVSFPMNSTQSPAQTKTIVAHEVAHQWFYGLVGDDEYLTPWIDESFATFGEQWFDGDLNPHAAKATSIPVSTPVSAFMDSGFPEQTGKMNGNGPGDYYTAVYQRGAGVLAKLRADLGAKKFDDLMRAYVSQYAYQVATTQDFINAVSTVAGKNETSFFQSNGVRAYDAWTTKPQAWVKLEEAENGRTWNGGKQP